MTAVEWEREKRWHEEYDEWIRPHHSLVGWCVTNVPFRFGTICFREPIYCEAHVESTQALAEALSIGYQRFFDFQRLEADNARKSRELEEARRLRLSMLPKQLPIHPHVDIAWHMETATEVGGDYYDYILTDDGMLTVVLGDATGHGMAAGVVVTAAKMLFQSFGHQPNMVETFTAISRNFKGLNLKRMGIAMNMVKIKDHTMQVSSAGNPPVLLYRAAANRVEEILIPGLPLGLSDMGRYEQQIFELAPGDTILLMSDGLPERFNSADEEFGYPRVEGLFADVATEEPHEIVQRLIQGGETWANNRLQDDDITLVVLKVKG